jgi:hypothetical protein
MVTSRRMGTDKQQRESEGPLLTDKALSCVRHNGQRVRDEVTASLPPTLRAVAWQQFQQMPIARWACLLLSLLEPQGDIGLYRRRSRRPAISGLFDDIPLLAERDKAKEIYAELCGRHSQRLDSCGWLRPVLAGRARRLATHPEAHGSAWGRQMRRIKGGKHTQRRYREQGWHPLPSVRKAWGLSKDRPHYDTPNPPPRLPSDSKL